MRTQLSIDTFKVKVLKGGEKYAFRLGAFVEAEAKDIITLKIYNRPQRGRYIRTGLARASIQTELKRSEKAVYVGADEKSFKKTAKQLGVDTGGLTFYLPYLEFGVDPKAHTSKKGKTYTHPGMPAVGMLRGGLDKLRQRLGML